MKCIDSILETCGACGHPHIPKDTIVTGVQVWDHMRRHGYLVADFKDFQNEVFRIKAEGFGADAHMESKYYAIDVAEWLGY